MVSERREVQKRAQYSGLLFSSRRLLIHKQAPRVLDAEKSLRWCNRSVRAKTKFMASQGGEPSELHWRTR